MHLIRVKIRVLQTAEAVVVKSLASMNDLKLEKS